MTFDLSKVLHSGQGFFLLNLVAVRYSCAIRPTVDTCWPLHGLWRHQCTSLWSGIFLPNLVAVWHLWSIWPLVYSGWPLHDLWPQQCITVSSGVLPTKFGSHRAFLSNLTPLVDPVFPCMTFDHSNALHFGQGFFLPNLVATVFLSNLTPDWPKMTPVGLHDLWYHQCTSLWSWIFLPNLVAVWHLWSIWPLVNPDWPLHDLWPPTMHYSFVRGSSYQI